jgi:hypothetical protein
MHIYELRLQSTTSHPASRKRVSICMSALGRLSDIWLVAKMVQELFEIILETAGFGDYAIEDGLSYRPNGQRKMRTSNTSTSDSAGPENSKEEARTLTAALQAHKEATLKYVRGRERAENNNELSINSTIPLHVPETQTSQTNNQIPVPEPIIPANIWMTSPTAPISEKPQHFQIPAFDTDNNSSYMCGDQMTTSWMPMDFNNVMPTALDVGDW